MRPCIPAIKQKWTTHTSGCPRRLDLPQLSLLTKGALRGRCDRSQKSRKFGNCWVSRAITVAQELGQSEIGIKLQIREKSRESRVVKSTVWNRIFFRNFIVKHFLHPCQLRFATQRGSRTEFSGRTCIRFSSLGTSIVLAKWQTTSSVLMTRRCPSSFASQRNPPAKPNRLKIF